MSVEKPDPALPSDIYPETLSRLPPVRREALSEVGQRAYDLVTDPSSRLKARLDGPAQIWLRVPELSRHAREINWHLRNRTNLSARELEVVILATARETDAQFEWYAHEKLAREAGADELLIDVIRFRRPLDGIAERDALLIGLVRGAVGADGVSSGLYACALTVFGEETLVQIVLVAANYAMTAIILHAFDKRTPPGQEKRLPDLG